MSQALAARIAIGGVFWGAILFIAAVSVFWPWWKSQLGWSIVAKSVALAIAVLPAMLVYWFGPGVYKDVPWLGWVTIGALAFVPPILVWRAVIIWQAQRRARELL